MEDDELLAFREQWKQELKGVKRSREFGDDWSDGGCGSEVRHGEDSEEKTTDCGNEWRGGGCGGEEALRRGKDNEKRSRDCWDEQSGGGKEEVRHGEDSEEKTNCGNKWRGGGCGGEEALRRGKDNEKRSRDYRDEQSGGGKEEVRHGEDNEKRSRDYRDEQSGGGKEEVRHGEDDEKRIREFGDKGSDGGIEAVRHREDTQPKYVSIAAGLLEGRSGPLLDRIEEERRRRKRRHAGEDTQVNSAPQKRLGTEVRLIDQFIQDLNETNDIPFFDVELPYELALKIFQFLGKVDLGRCAQVSKSWRVLAEDEVLWYRLCLEEGYHTGASVSDSPCWKSTLRDCCNSEKLVMYNWKNRVGMISQLQYELGKVLCDVSSSDRHVIAGYTSGAIRLWDTLHWDSGALNLRAAHAVRDETPPPHVSFVRVNETLASAAYENGCVSVWSTESGLEPVHQYQHLQRVQAFDLSPDAPILTTASGLEVRVDSPDDRGYWRTRCLTRLAKPVDGLLVVPGMREVPLVSAWAGESVYLLGSDQREEEEEEEEGAKVLHSVYGQPVTCLDVTASRAAVGVKRCGWGMNDGGNKVHLYVLETGQAELTMGNSAGDFTCINLRDSPPHLLVCGNKDRRVRVFDLRTGSSVVSLYAHHMGVTTVQADDWKIVSGGGEGLVSVWEMRMGAKLWEIHNRHPVRHIHFNASTLLTANIPDEKTPRGACITDDDLTAHRRHRGAICYYDFSEDTSTQDHVLPICRSNYSERSGYNYNIGLAMPYDTLADPRTSGL